VPASTQAEIDAKLRIAQQEHDAAMARLGAERDAENNRHSETVARLEQEWKIHQDDYTLSVQKEQEDIRHNQALEQLERDRQALDLKLEQMKEANAIQLEQMREGNQILLQQGEQAFKDWQARQSIRMQILSSALNNPWLQRLTGMTPQGMVGAPTGGQNIQDLINQILQPYYPGAPGGGGAPTTATTAGGGMPAAPSWQQWQTMDPFQRAAFRTNVEALGPGAWQQEQAAMQSGFGQQGGTPDITAMQRAAASPVEQAGQEMTAETFGQTVPQWQQQQQKTWSQALAPNVKQNLAGIAA
jgi:hypothetical protein